MQHILKTLSMHTWSTFSYTRAGACKEVARMLKEKEDAAGGVEKDKSISAGTEMQNLRILEVNMGWKKYLEGSEETHIMLTKVTPISIWLSHKVMAEDCGDLAATYAIPAMPAVLVLTGGEVIIGVQVQELGGEGVTFLLKVKPCNLRFNLLIELAFFNPESDLPIHLWLQVSAQLIGKTEVMEKLEEAIKSAKAGVA